MNDDDEVGYGKPPRQHRFKPGNTMAKGHRKGRGKRADFTMSEIVTRAMLTRRQVRRGNRLIDMQVAEIMVERLIQMATNGSARDAAYILNLIDRHAAHLVAQPLQEMQVTYHHAPGASVELPWPGLWKEEGE